MTAAAENTAERRLSPADIGRRGIMLVLSSPSGAGKTTIAHRLLEVDGNVISSISATTRAPRPGEVPGVHYSFTDPDSFRQMVRDGQLLEYANVFGNFYGTPRAPVEAALARGQDVLFDIDWQGTQQLAAIARADLVTIFILPPSWAELERRLRSRGQDSDEVIARRMAKAADEMSHYFEYKYVIINEDIESSVAKVRTILDAERLKRRRQIGLVDYVRGLQMGV